jgi:hypothetical protein
MFTLKVLSNCVLLLLLFVSKDDGYDETLIPVDFQKAGQIKDDDLLKVLVHPMKAGVTMTCLMDCCHR